MLTPAGLYAIAVLRVAIGLLFVLAAPSSRAPRTLRVLGLIVIVAGLATPWFGVARGPSGSELVGECRTAVDAPRRRRGDGAWRLSRVRFPNAASTTNIVDGAFSLMPR